MIDYTNKLFNMDNLELMRQLPNGCINLIYCDVLYNTGCDFTDYNDNLGTPRQAIEWYNPRLNEMKRLLKNNGSVYLQCDYRLSHYLKVKMDEIFGFDNFRNDIIWKRDSVGKGAKKTSKQWSRELDNILMYSKGKDVVFNQQYKTISELGYTQLKEFRYSEPDGRKYKIVTLGDYSQESINNMKQLNLIHKTSTGKEYRKLFDEDGVRKSIRGVKQ